VLLAYDAELELISAAGTRRVPYAGFHRGYKQMDLRPGEIIARVILPPRDIPPEGGNHTIPVASAFRRNEFYRKVGTRRAQAISKVCFAGTLVMNGTIVKDVRIALGSVAPTVIRATAAEAALRGRPIEEQVVAEAERALASEIAPIDDLRSTARYRSRVAGNLLREFLSQG
jgi:CO/xanthine dehydrogenase FAD-binding subunit